jgi:hypothetical protein
MNYKLVRNMFEIGDSLPTKLIFGFLIKTRY